MFLPLPVCLVNRTLSCLDGLCKVFIEIVTEFPVRCIDALESIPSQVLHVPRNDLIYLLSDAFPFSLIPLSLRKCPVQEVLRDRGE